MPLPGMTIRSALEMMGAGSSVATPNSLYNFVHSTAALQSAADEYIAGCGAAPFPMAQDYRAGDLYSAALVLSRIIEMRAVQIPCSLFRAIESELDPPATIVRSFRQMRPPQPFDRDAAARRYFGLLAEALAYEIPLRSTERGNFFVRSVEYDPATGDALHGPVLQEGDARERIFRQYPLSAGSPFPKYVLIRRLEDRANILVVGDPRVDHANLTQWRLRTAGGAERIDGMMEIVAAGFIRNLEQGSFVEIDGGSGSFPTNDDGVADTETLPLDNVEFAAEAAGLISALEILSLGLPDLNVGIYGMK